MNQNQELLAWAAAKIQKEQDENTFGTITFRLEGGVITHSEVKRMDKPGSEQKVLRKSV